jgi:GH35 family endo-1,4-beta-xylanase
MFHRSISACVVAVVVSALPLAAVEIPPGGQSLNVAGELSGYADAKIGQAGKFLSADGQPGGFRITISEPQPTQPFRAQIAAACPDGELAKGDKVLAIVKARAINTEAGSLVAKLQLSGAPYTEAAATTSFDLSPTWTEYPLLFVVENPLPAGKAGLSLFCAQAAQTVEVASVQVLRYPPTTDVANFPRIRRTYVGREPDAPWRKAALERIEKIRKADCAATFTRADGTPLANTAVTLTLRRHEFGFGSATPASYYVNDTEDGRRYRDIIDRLFSIVVFENDLKDMWWGESTPAAEKTKRRAEMDRAFDWLEERHIAIRGHYLMQQAIPGNCAKMDPATVRRHFVETAKERIAFAGNRVCEWDAINHPIAWGGAELFRTRPGLEELDREILALARSLTKLPLWVNEDQLFRSGPQSDGTWEYLRQLKEDGIRVDGLGNQAHLHESYLPSPERILAVTDHFAQLVPRQSITEFDLKTTADEELAADYTRDLLIACFSHPAYTSFLWWGFWEGSHWEPTAASWKKDWTILKRGEVLEEWLGKRWRTQVTLTTDAAGTVSWRGFPGWYDVLVGALPAGACQVTMAKPKTSVKVGSPTIRQGN